MRNPILIYIRFHCNKSKFLSYFFSSSPLTYFFFIRFYVASFLFFRLRNYFLFRSVLSSRIPFLVFIPCSRRELRFYFPFFVHGFGPQLCFSFLSCPCFFRFFSSAPAFVSLIISSAVARLLFLHVVYLCFWFFSPLCSRVLFIKVKNK